MNQCWWPLVFFYGSNMPFSTNLVDPINESFQIAMNMNQLFIFLNFGCWLHIKTINISKHSLLPWQDSKHNLLPKKDLFRCVIFILIDSKYYMAVVWYRSEGQEVFNRKWNLITFTILHQANYSNIQALIFFVHTFNSDQNNLR